MKHNLFFDLDGTILDVRTHHYAVYVQVAKQLHLHVISLEEYWQKKREKLPPVPVNHEIYYREIFKDQCETHAMLALETKVPRIDSLLKNLQEKYALVLVTRRNNEHHLLEQLQNLGLKEFFTSILVTTNKMETIKTFGYTKKDLLIGDTEEDIQTAKGLGLQSVAVTWGLRSKEYLQQHSPTHVVDTIDQLAALF